MKCQYIIILEINVIINVPPRYIKKKSLPKLGEGCISATATVIEDTTAYPIDYALHSVLRILSITLNSLWSYLLLMLLIGHL